MKRLFLGLILSILFLDFTSAQSDYQSEIATIDESVESAFETLNPTGISIAVVKDGKVIYKKALGVKDIETGEAVTTKSLFNIASCSKAFTGASMGLLAQEGQLNWDDKVIDYLPDFRLSDPYITREMDLTDILCHRSGLKTFVGDLLWYGTDYTDEDVFERLRYIPIDNGFRRDYGYSNLMYMTAGEVIEDVSGLNWSDFIQKNFFDPLEMKDSRPSSDELDMNQNIAFPHIKGVKQPIYDWNASKAAAGIYSSVEDLSHWVQMLLAGGTYQGQEILQTPTINHLFKPQTLVDLSWVQRTMGSHFHAYGLGWFMFDYKGRKILEHDGGMPGYISKVALIPEENLGIIILNNGGNYFSNDAIALSVFDAFMGIEGNDWIDFYNKRNIRYSEYIQEFTNDREESVISRTKPSLELKSYAGSFVEENYHYGNASVTFNEGKLTLSLLPNEDMFTAELAHFHYDTFRFTFKDDFLAFGLITFEFNERGQVSGFKLDVPSGDFYFDNLHFVKE